MGRIVWLLLTIFRRSLTPHPWEFVTTSPGCFLGWFWGMKMQKGIFPHTAGGICITKEALRRLAQHLEQWRGSSPARQPVVNSGSVTNLRVLVSSLWFCCVVPTGSAVCWVVQLTWYRKWKTNVLITQVRNPCITNHCRNPPANLFARMTIWMVICSEDLEDDTTPLEILK